MESNDLQSSSSRRVRSVPETRCCFRREETGVACGGDSDVCSLRSDARTNILLYGTISADLGGDLFLSNTWSLFGGGDGGEDGGRWEIPTTASCVGAVDDWIRDGDEFLAVFPAVFEV